MSIYTLLPKIETQFISKDIPDIDYGDTVHLDIETSGLDPVNDQLWVINIGYGPIEDGTFQKSVICRIPDEVTCPPNLEKLMTGKSLKIIHNAIFDATWIYIKWGVKISNIRCTKILARLRRRSRNGYAALTKAVTGLELPKGAITLSPWNLPFDQWSADMKNYCAYDVCFGYKIYKYLDALITSKEREKYLTICQAFPPLLEAFKIMSYRDVRLL